MSPAIDDAGLLIKQSMVPSTALADGTAFAAFPIPSSFFLGGEAMNRVPQLTIALSISLVLWQSDARAACQAGSSSGPHENESVAEKKLKALMDKEALAVVKDLFGETYDPKCSRLVNAKEIRSLVSQSIVEVKQLPEWVQQRLDDKEAVGLVIPGLGRSDQSEKPAEKNGAIYLRRSGRAYYGGFFITLALRPCNGGFCLYCSGCRGMVAGIYVDCVCTNSCAECRACPRCETRSETSGDGGWKRPRRLRGLLRCRRM